MPSEPAVPQAIDPQRFRQTLGLYPTGVTIITGLPPHDDDAPAMVIGSFGSVSLDPPLVMFMPGKSSATWPLIEAGGHFAVSVLGDGHDVVAGRLVSKSGDHFEEHGWRQAASGAPVLEDCIAWLDCAITDVHDAGDHWIVVGTVNELGGSDHPDTPSRPLVFWQGKYLS